MSIFKVPFEKKLCSGVRLYESYIFQSNLIVMPITDALHLEAMNVKYNNIG